MAQKKGIKTDTSTIDVITNTNRLTTPYVNTIPVHEEPSYPGDLEIEQRLRNYNRWNAMAMVVKANRDFDGLGGHISTYASSAVLYEVGFNHFFKGQTESRIGDHIYFQGHASPGIYARAYLEGRLSASKLHRFRQELSEGGGLSSYPHPYLMPDFWQFPTVSMGLGPIMSIYQARFNRYMMNRNLLKTDEEPHVWCFVGDGEVDEPETLGALSIAAREKLDNLTFVVNCNLQRLDGPVRGNGKIIQELESVFRGAGWNVIKVVWSSEWDDLFKSEHADLLIKRMGEVVDGEYQKYTVEPGSYTRKHFFGKYPELLDLVSHMSDQEIHDIRRGGHDPVKMYAAYHAALNHKGTPTVILAKTIKGYGLGEAGEGKNISHQQKKMNEKELREFRQHLKIPISDEDVVETPFYKPTKGSDDANYVVEKRQTLGGHLPARFTDAPKLKVPGLELFNDFLTDSKGSEMSTTMAFVRMLSKLLKDKSLGQHIVPIIPDEARTFGMESLFRQIGIYAPFGQQYEPADSDSLLYYKEAKDGQILEEGINEAGAMSSFLAAATAYSSNSQYMIPFYIYYSMFGFQRVGDMMWLAGDIRAKGFLLGGTSGRTTLNGEGLQHQDGHSLLLAGSIPTIQAYDTAYRYEIAVILQDGLKRMYGDDEDIFYYLTLGNENYLMPAMPEGAEEGILKGLYLFSKSTLKGIPLNLFGSGSLMNEAVKAKELLEEYGVSVSVFGATNYKRLREESLEADRWNMLNPSKKPKQSYLQELVAKQKGAFVAVSDNMKLVSDQISQWIPEGLMSLGTDGFGRSDTRENLRKHFEVNAEMIVVASLYKLSQLGQVDVKLVTKAIKKYNIDGESIAPLRR